MSISISRISFNQFLELTGPHDEGPSFLSYEFVCPNISLAKMMDLFGGLEDRHYFLCPKITDSQDQVSFCYIEPGSIYIDKDGNTQVAGWLSSLYAKEDDDFLVDHFQYLMKVLTIDDFQRELIQLDSQSA